jgi:hypothetical protein
MQSSALMIIVNQRHFFWKTSLAKEIAVTALGQPA